MDRGEQGRTDNTQPQPENVPSQTAQGQQQTQHDPQAALAAVTRGESAPAPPATAENRPSPAYPAEPRPFTAEKSPFEDGGTTQSGHGSGRGDGDPYRRRSGNPAVAVPQRARSRDDVYRSGENVVSPSRRRGPNLDWMIGHKEQHTYTVNHAIFAYRWGCFSQIDVLAPATHGWRKAPANP